MAWTTLILGVLLMAIGLAGQVFGIRKSSTLAPQDRHTRNWIFTVGTVVIGLWVVAFSAAHFLHHHH
ncbi:MAG TPA: hypothetical protein VHZ25_08275 [Acidobacteriaceae bacterium]|jgi:hypothetical protein|nr:hypothetical protein [Acidobacteriaceae bacterium]